MAHFDLKVVYKAIRNINLPPATFAKQNRKIRPIRKAFNQVNAEK